MPPHGSRIVDPEEQLEALRPGHYLRLTVSQHGAMKIRHLLRHGQLSAKKRVHDLLGHADQNGSWPSGLEYETIRVDPTERFDTDYSF